MSSACTRALRAVVATAVLTACSGADHLTPTSPLLPDSPARMDGTSLTDTITKMVATLYPRNEQNPIAARWNNVQRKLADGQDRVAQSQFTELAQWIQDKTPNMLTPPAGETPAHASGRLILYMSLIVYRVPVAQQPAVSPVGDMTYAIAQPAATTRIVVPSTNAGLQLDPGSVAGPTIVVISQVTSPWYPANCSGPLDTWYYQYPSFYRYDEYPHVGLLKPGHFQMCHVQPNTYRGFVDGQVHGAIDGRLALAHTKPANASQNIPGGTIVDGIELLPQATSPSPRMVPNDCNGVTYPSSANGFASFTAPKKGLFDGALQLLASATSAVGRVITPKDAYAYDQGIEHLSLEFSPFAAVDTGGRPDVGASS